MQPVFHFLALAHARPLHVGVRIAQRACFAFLRTEAVVSVYEARADQEDVSYFYVSALRLGEEVEALPLGAGF